MPMKSLRYSKHFPLSEQIGPPELFVGRDKELAKLHDWVKRIAWKRAKSRAMLARKKSGKTAILQRLFNQLWSAGDGGEENPWEAEIIPFYFEFKEMKQWLPDLALEYYQTFASQYISYLERDPAPIKHLLSWERIRDYGKENKIELLMDDIDSLFGVNKDRDSLMWTTAYSAPHRFAAVYERPILVMLDEFQYISQYIYTDKAKTLRDETLPGSYHRYSESKIAPMLVTGSYVGWLVQLIDQYLEAGRLKEWTFPSYLTEEEGLEAVYKYADFSQEAVTPLTALAINRLCLSDPFFISCVIDSDYEDRDLTTEQGVIDTIQYELSNRKSEMVKTWSEYINQSVARINDVNAKNILLHLSKHNDREWTHLELKETLKLDLAPQDILKRLIDLSKADLIESCLSDIAFQGLQDGTLYLILRKRFGQEIASFSADLQDDFQEQYNQLKKENRSLRGKLNYLAGKMAEELFATELRTRKRFVISVYFTGLDHLGEVATKSLNLVDVRSRFLVQRDDEKNMEIDVIARSEDRRTLLIEIKNRQEASTLTMVEDFWEKIKVYRQHHPTEPLLPGFLSFGGFNEEALQFCEAKGIGTATEIAYLQTEW